MILFKEKIKTGEVIFFVSLLFVTVYSIINASTISSNPVCKNQRFLSNSASDYERTPCEETSDRATSWALSFTLLLILQSCLFIRPIWFMRFYYAFDEFTSEIFKGEKEEYDPIYTLLKLTGGYGICSEDFPLIFPMFKAFRSEDKEKVVMHCDNALVEVITQIVLLEIKSPQDDIALKRAKEIENKIICLRKIAIGNVKN